jgi:hypothetical protein
VAQCALDARPGKTGVPGVALSLDGVVDDAYGATGTEVHRADGIEEQGGFSIEHGADFLGFIW